MGGPLEPAFPRALTVDEIQVEHEKVRKAARGEHFSMAVPWVVRRSDKLYKLVDANHRGTE